MSADNTSINDSDSDLEIDPGTITPPTGSPKLCESPMLHDILSTVCDNAVDDIIFQANETGKLHCITRKIYIFHIHAITLSLDENDNVCTINRKCAVILLVKELLSRNKNKFDVISYIIICTYWRKK
jgi:hypothetical protein